MSDFVICIDNNGNPASLIVGQSLPNSPWWSSRASQNDSSYWRRHIRARWLSLSRIDVRFNRVARSRKSVLWWRSV